MFRNCLLCFDVPYITFSICPPSGYPSKTRLSTTVSDGLLWPYDCPGLGKFIYQWHKLRFSNMADVCYSFILHTQRMFVFTDRQRKPWFQNTTR